MVQRIRFGTMEQIQADMSSGQPVQESRLVQAGLVSPADYLLRFSGYMDAVPTHEEFPIAMKMTGLRWRLVEDNRPENVVIENGGRIVSQRNGRIFQLAHNVLAIARQVPIGGADEIIEFRDLSGCLAADRNALHA